MFFRFLLQSMEVSTEDIDTMVFGIYLSRPAIECCHFLLKISGYENFPLLLFASEKKKNFWKFAFYMEAAQPFFFICIDLHEATKKISFRPQLAFISKQVALLSCFLMQILYESKKGKTPNANGG